MKNQSRREFIKTSGAAVSLLLVGGAKVKLDGEMLDSKSISYENPMPDMTLEGYIGQIPNLRPEAYHHRYHAFTDPGEQLYFNITGNSDNLKPSWNITEDSANPGHWTVDVYFATKGEVSDDTLDIKFSDVPLAIDDTDSPGVPEHFKLNQNYPNPFNGVTNIEYDLPYTTDVHAKVYNMAGQEVADISPGKQSVGQHKLRWDSGDIPSGVYVLHMVAGDYGSQSIRMVHVE